MRKRASIWSLLGLAVLCGARAAHAESATDVSPICSTVFTEQGKRTLLGRGAYCQRAEPIERQLVGADGSVVGQANIDVFAYSDNSLNNLSWDVKFRFRTKLVSGQWTGLQIEPIVECGDLCTVTPVAGVDLVPGGLSEEVTVTVTPNMGDSNPLFFQPTVYYRTTQSGDSFDGPTSAGPHQGITYVPEVRCDVGLARKATKGCVYHEAPAVFRDIKTTDPDVDESAVHIKDAQAAGLPGKYVLPDDGSILPAWGSSPLTRTRVPKTIMDNRREAKKLCVAKYGEVKEACNVSEDPDDEPTPCDCDEYPFASTQEGASVGGAVSVKSIDSSDNQRTGSRLGNFYTSQRVLDQDKFYISIDQ